jgi:hypothetical protein
MTPEGLSQNRQWSWAPLCCAEPKDLAGTWGIILLTLRTGLEPTVSGRNSSLHTAAGRAGRVVFTRRTSAVRRTYLLQELWRRDGSGLVGVQHYLSAAPMGYTMICLAFSFAGGSEVYKGQNLQWIHFYGANMLVRCGPKTAQFKHGHTQATSSRVSCGEGHI